MIDHKKENRLFFIGYLAIGALANVMIVILPIFLLSKNMSEQQIVYLLAASYFAALIQPLIGYISDTIIGPVKMLKISSISMIILTFFIYLSSSFYLLFILIFLLAIFRNTTFPLFDNIILYYCNNNDLNYGSLRRGGSIGFGLGVLFTVPLFLLFGNNESILIIAILSLVFLLTLNLLNLNATEPIKENITLNSYKNNVVKLSKSKIFTLLIIINIIIMGTSSMKLSYQSTLVSTLDASIIYLIFLNIFTILPEVLFISKGSKLFKYNISYILSICILIAAGQNLMLLFSNSLPLILILTMAHGLIMSMYIPTFNMFLIQNLSKETTATGFILNNTIQSLGIFLISTLIIGPMLTFFSFKSVFLILAIILLSGLIPVIMLHKTLNKEN